MSASTAPDLRHLVADLVHALGEIHDDLRLLVYDQRYALQISEGLGRAERLLGDVERVRGRIEAASSESPSESGARS